VVYIHEVAEERGGRVFHCDLEDKPSARCLTVPGWMFDRAVCLGVRRAEGPQVQRLVDRAAVFSRTNKQPMQGREIEAFRDASSLGRPVAQKQATSWPVR
jgi:hypothetical protein